MAEPTLFEQISTAAENTNALVQSGFQNAQNYAREAWHDTEEFLEDLSDIASEAVMPDFDDIEYDYTTTELNTDITSKRPEAPTETDLDLGSITPPISPALIDIDLPDLPTIPAFSDLAPAISYPSAPDATMPTPVGEAPTLAEVTLPTEPSLTMPTVPTFQPIVLPSLPDISLPSFTGTMPSDADLIAPDNLFVYGETAFSSDLWNAVKAKLLTDVQNGGTGLSTDEEQALYDRALSRQETQWERMYNEAEDYFAARGFNIPPGALAGRIQEISLEIERATALLSNEVLIKMAELAQENTRFALTAAIQFDTQVMTHANNVANRTFEVSKAVCEYANKTFEIKVTKYNAQLEAYKTCAAVYESRIRALLAELEIYKTQMEGAKISLEAQNVQAQIYQSQLAAVEMAIKVYQASMQGAAMRLDAEKSKLEAFRLKVEAYTAQINAKTSEFNMYQARIAGEQAKIQVYSEKVKAFGIQMEAAKTQVQLLTANVEAQVEINKSLNENYKTDIERYKAEILKESTRVENLVKVYGFEVEGYKADAQVDSMAIEKQLKVIEMRITEAKNHADLLMKEAELALQNAVNAHNMQVEAAKAGAQVAAQVAASALSAMNTNASIGYSAGQSQGYSGSHSTQESESLSHDYNFNYDMTGGE